MTVKEVIEALPEEQRAEAQKAIDAEIAAGNKLAGIDTQEKALALINETPALKSALDAGISKAVASHDERFKAEKLPGLVKAEMEKLNPPKDPRDVEIAELKKVNAERDAREQRQAQLTVALRVAAEEKIPTKYAELLIRDTEEATAAAVKDFAKTWNDQINTGVETLLKERYGNDPPPKRGGEPNENQMKRADFEALDQEKRAEKIKEGVTLID